MGKLYEVWVTYNNEEQEIVRANGPEEAVAIAFAFSTLLGGNIKSEFRSEECEGEDEGPEHDDDNGVLSNSENTTLRMPRVYAGSYPAVYIF